MKGFECGFCGKETDGCYVDRNMNFCNPSCAVKQGCEKDNTGDIPARMKPSSKIAYVRMQNV